MDIAMQQRARIAIQALLILPHAMGMEQVPRGAKPLPAVTATSIWLAVNNVNRILSARQCNA
jgi:hypothetical protein